MDLICYIKKPSNFIFFTANKNDPKLDDPKLDDVKLDSVDYEVTNSNFGWRTFKSNLFHPLLSVTQLHTELELFFKYYKLHHPETRFFAIIFKIRFDNNDIRSCSTTQIGHIDQFEALFTVFKKVFFIKYFFTIISETFEKMEENKFVNSNVLFSFKPMKTIKNTKYEDFHVLKDTALYNRDDCENFEKFKYKDYKLPSTMDLTVWPNIQFAENYTHAFAAFNLTNKKNDYPLSLNINIADNRIISFINANKNVFLFYVEDTILNRYDLTEFKREVYDNDKIYTYYLSNGKVKLYTSQIPVNFIKRNAKDLKTKPKIMTLDFETRDITTTKLKETLTFNENVFAQKTPIAVSLYDGYHKYSAIFKNPNTWSAELSSFIKNNLLKRKYDYYKIYIHNFSFFDAVFLIDVLTELGNVKPIIRDNKILKITLTFKVNDSDKRMCRLIFYDSNLIFQASLRKLSKSFGIENKKTFFPFGFMNSDHVNFDYSGEVPQIEQFLNTITKDEYEEYKNNFPNNSWNFSKELIKYCENDTIALYQIIRKFYNEIYSSFQIDITKYPTLPSIAFAIYRSNYLIYDYKIPNIGGKLHYVLKHSYYGGISEAYKPTGRNIHSYDVNSLYPHSMWNFDMPVGKPQHFIGDISFLHKDQIPFGFLRVKVNAPLSVKYPALPLKYTEPSMKRTLFPVGEWEGWYFSEEIKDKLQQGYTFEILEGYLFEKKNIFKSYIEDLYLMKASSNSDDPKYFIAKLLMNSIYGRFGLNPDEKEVVIVSDGESEAYISSKKNVIATPLLSGKVMLSFDQNNLDDFSLNNISVPISAAIASYSRITMNKFLRKYEDLIYSIDTDGIKTTAVLDPSDVDNKKLGYMKYEYTLKEAVFPAPKVYGGKLEKPYKGFNDELVKIKGVKNPIKYDRLKTVLNKNNKLIINQEKWLRRLDNSTILVKNEDYTLEIRESKRELIYNPWGDLVATLPFKMINSNTKKLRGAGPYYHLKNPYIYNV